MTNTGTAAPYRVTTAQAASHKGMRPGEFTADEIHAFLPADGAVVSLWDSMDSAKAGSSERFSRSHMRAIAAGVEIVAQDKGAWSIVLIHPLGVGRIVRILTK